MPLPGEEDDGEEASAGELLLFLVLFGGTDLRARFGALRVWSEKEEGERERERRRGREWRVVAVV